MLMRRLLELLRLHVHSMLRLRLRVLVVIELLLVAHATGIQGLLAMVLERRWVLLLLVLRLRHLLLHLRCEMVPPGRVAVYLLLLLLLLFIVA